MRLLCIILGHRMGDQLHKFGPMGLFKCERCARMFLVKLHGTEYGGARSPWDKDAKALIAGIYPDLWMELPPEVRDGA